MSVYVDPIMPTYWFGKRNGFKYDHACHLMADSEAELEEFARKLKLRKSWRHGDHYDLTANKRREAVKVGAIEVTARELVRIRRLQSESTA